MNLPLAAVSTHSQDLCYPPPTNSRVTRNVLMREDNGTPVNAMNNPSVGENTNDWGRRSFQISANITW